MDTLTFEDLMTLRQPFAAHEHEFTRSFTYISEQAVTTRIEDVDPAWTFAILSTVIRDNQAVVTARLTLKGVSREGVGMQALTYTDKKTGEIKENGEPEKGAATDALKRCARLFGIGRYLLDLPTSINDMNSLAEWLANSGSIQQDAPATPKGKPAPKVDNSETKVGVSAVVLEKAYEMVKGVMERGTFDIIVGSLTDLKPNPTPMFLAKRAMDTLKAREKLAS